jgi:hypothetical protein
MEDAEIERLMGKRLEALSKLDAKPYAALCDATGMEPEDSELYKEGAEILNQEKEQKEMGELREKHREFERTLARTIPNSRYRRFLAEARERKIAASDLCSGTVQKRSLLFKFFPEDFAPGRPRDLRFRGAHAVGTIFSGVANYAKRRMREQRGQERMKMV